MSWVKVGAKCVCIRGPLIMPWYNEIGPAIGEVYTVRAIHPDGDAIWLREITNRPQRYDNGYHEMSFFIQRFRPLVTIEDDLSHFTHLLQPSLVDKLDLLKERLDELAED